MGADLLAVTLPEFRVVVPAGQYPAFKVDFRGLLPPDSDDGYYDMRLSEMSAEYLSRCKFGGAKWYQFDELELVQL